VGDTRRPHREYFWERHTAGDGTWGRSSDVPSGEDLAALRRGIGKEAGGVPEMWPFYTTLAADGRLSDALRAEHLALTLFAVHQQSLSQPAHRSGVGFGSAMKSLRESEQFSAEAVDRRFTAAATATSLAELGVHVRGLITQLRGIRPQPGLDYTLLFRDLREWQWPDRVAAVRRRWGSQYFVRLSEADATSSSDSVVDAAEVHSTQ
jgi:CRISPR system Cascade subunit CasB